MRPDLRATMSCTLRRMGSALTASVLLIAPAAGQVLPEVQSSSRPSMVAGTPSDNALFPRLGDTPTFTWLPVPWRVGTLSASYFEAAARGLPLVVLFEQNDCGFCGQLREAIRNEPAMATFYQKAVFVAVNVQTDEDGVGNVAAIVAKLKIDRFPQLVVIEAHEDHGLEIGRIEGFLRPPELGQVVAAIFANGSKP